MGNLWILSTNERVFFKTTGIIHLIQLSDAGKAGQEQEPGGLTDLSTSLPAKDQLQDTCSEVCSCLTYLTLPSFNENTFNFTFKQFLNPWWPSYAGRNSWFTVKGEEVRYGKTVDTVVFVFPSLHVSLPFHLSQTTIISGLYVMAH